MALLCAEPGRSCARPSGPFARRSTSKHTRPDRAGGGATEAKQLSFSCFLCVCLAGRFAPLMAPTGRGGGSWIAARAHPLPLMIKCKYQGRSPLDWGEINYSSECIQNGACADGSTCTLWPMYTLFSSLKWNSNKGHMFEFWIEAARVRPQM